MSIPKAKMVLPEILPSMYKVDFVDEQDVAYIDADYLPIPKKDLEQVIKDEYGVVKLKRGRYYIIKAEHEDHHELWHQCDKDSTLLDIVTYETTSEHTYLPIKPGWRCMCGMRPPESIVGVWCLLEPDYTSEEVQSELNKDDEIAVEVEGLDGWGMSWSWSER